MADIKTQLDTWLTSENLTDEFEDSYLKEMGQKLYEWFEEDKQSRKDWEDRMDKWLKLATQAIEKKTYPWQDAANVKYPLLTTAAMQFAARAYPALVRGVKLVDGLVIGVDNGGVKTMSAQRVGAHMSYQLLYEMPGWEEDMDKLCFVLPILGCLFKKTYYSPLKKVNCSELVLPQDLIIDYYAPTLSQATRVCHIIYLTENQVKERENLGIFDIDQDLGQPRQKTEVDRTREKIEGIKEPKVGPATPHKFIECHCWWDLDEDGYDEPWIVTVHCATRQVVRIVARFNSDGVTMDEKGQEIARIEPIEYFTKFGFIPNPDGSIYDLGFGLLLGGINETVNTLTNQLLDSGTLNNLQSGFLGRGIRVRGGNTRFIPGEWKPVDFTGEDIKKHIFSLPTKEPSDTLFKLLELLVGSSKEISSTADIFTGKLPGQNTPATVMMASIDQGSKVNSAIYKRIYRSLGEEYKKLFDLNSVNMDQQVYFTINEPEGPTAQTVYKQDYNKKNINVRPNADPNIVSDAQRLMKIQALQPLLQLGTINPKIYTKRYLKAIDEENINELLTADDGKSPYTPPPPPEVGMAKEEQQTDLKKEKMRETVKVAGMHLQAGRDATEMSLKKQELALEAQGQQIDALNEHVEQLLKSMEIMAKTHVDLKKVAKQSAGD